MSAAEAVRPLPLQVAPGSFRHLVLMSSKRFKATWAELGKLLVKVRDGGMYEEWGYSNFDAYCWKELHIRKATADKLTRSFSFLAKHEPSVAQSEELVEKAPAFEVMEVLAGAEDRGQISAEEYQSIRDSIWNPQKSTAELKRELVDRFPPPPPEPPPAAGRVKRLAAQARKLASDLSSTGEVPSATADRAVALAEELEQLAAGLSDG